MTLKMRDEKQKLMLWGDKSKSVYARCLKLREWIKTETSRAIRWTSLGAVIKQEA
jgi:hypothetical protein